MPHLKEYFDESTLRLIQDTFSAMVTRTVYLCDKSGKALLKDLGDAESWKHALDEMGRGGYKGSTGSPAGATDDAELDLPIRCEGKTLGRVRLDFSKDSKGKTTPERALQNKLLRMMTAVIGKLCENRAELNSRIKQLITLFEVTGKFSEPRGLQELLDTITKTTAKTMQAKACSIRLLSEDGKSLLIRAVHSFSSQYLDTEPIPLDQSPLDQEILNSDKPVYVANMQTDPRVVRKSEARREKVVSGLCAPMIYKDRTEGGLRVFKGRAYTFDWFETQLLQTLAHAAAAAIANARLHAEAVKGWEMKRQLDLASEVQKRMIPPNSPELTGYDINAIYVPSHQLAGDFYDFIELPTIQEQQTFRKAENIGIAVCDVVGKGVRASLLMASIRASLRAHASNLYEISEVLRRVNRDLCEGTSSGDFATLYYGVLQTRMKIFTYCSCAHMPAILVRNGQTRQLATKGGMVGAFAKMDYPTDSIALVPNDVILIFTDGLTEAINFEHEMYGRGRLEKALIFAVEQDYSAEAITRHCVWDMRRFAGLHSRGDDLTLIAIKVL